jgi:hypothetical protein
MELEDPVDPPHWDSADNQMGRLCACPFHHSFEGFSSSRASSTTQSETSP